MYKLENNVEWTNDLKDAFKHNITRAKIVYDNTEINYDNGIKEITLEDSVYVPDVGFIGQATSKKLTLILLDNEQTINLENKEFELYIGADYNNQTYYINYGKFIVNEPPENDSTNGTIKIIAYDYMIKFNKIYQDEVTYPIKLKDYLSNICTQAGVQLGSQTFPNQNFWVSDNQFEGKQLREVIKHIAKCAFSWARIGQDNKLYLDFNATGNVIETFGLDDYKQDGFKRANEYYGPINKVTYADSDIQGQEKSVPDESSIALIGTKELVIYDNFFAYTTQKRQDLIQSGNVLFGFNYMPVTQLELTGAIYLDCTDIIEVVDDKNNTIITRVFSHTIKYNGVISDTVSAPALSNNQETYKNINTTTNAENRTEIMVDRANKKIQSITSQIGNRSQKTTTITQDIESIESKVEDIEDLTRTVTGNKTVTISDAFPDENILELHIYGNNSVFNYLLPSDDLYPEDNLYPFGDSKIRFYNSKQDITIELNILEVLRSNNEVKDELLIDAQGNVNLIRRVNSDGTTKQIPTNTLLGELHFKLIEGDNTFEIVNYVAPIEVKYAIKSTLTDIFATKVEMNSSITQTAKEINLRVSKKVDETEVVSVINQSAEEIELKGNRVIIESTNFKLDKDGNIKAKNGEFSGDITIGTYDHLVVYDTEGKKMIQIENNGIVFFDSNGIQSNTISRTITGNNQGMTFKTHSNGSYVGIANGDNNKFVYNSDADKIDVYTQIDMHEATLRNVKNPIFNVYSNATDYYWGYPVIGYKDEHQYMMYWTGSQLQFYVDTTNVGTLSDERLKMEIQNIDETFVDIIEEIELKQFKIANRNGLISFGIIAQDLIEIFKKYDKNPFDYEIVTKTKYRMDDNTEFYTINYEQFLILKQKALDKKIKMLEEKDKNKESVINNLIKRIQRLEEK